MLEGGPVREDHDLVEEVWALGALEESSVAGLGWEEEAEAGEREREAGRGRGGYSEEWAEGGGRHGVWGFCVVRVGWLVGCLVWCGGDGCGGDGKVTVCHSVPRLSQRMCIGDHK